MDKMREPGSLQRIVKGARKEIRNLNVFVCNKKGRISEKNNEVIVECNG